MVSKDVEKVRLEFSVSEVAAQFGVALERDGEEWVALCPLHSEKTPSFTIFPGDDGVERFHCFGCGEKGDVLDFVQKVKGVGLREAISILTGKLDRPNVERKRVEARNIYAGIEPLDPPAEIEVGEWIELYNPKRNAWGKFLAEMVFPYHDADGKLFGYVLRRHLADGDKETPMVMRVRLPDGRECWSRFPFPRPRPLYGVHRINRGQVIVVEGEKCVDRFRQVSGRCVVSWAGGTYGIDHADWSALDGKDVIIWPDADEPGRKTAQRLASILAGKAKRVRVIDVAGCPDKWDVADAVDEGWSSDDIDRFMRERVQEIDVSPPAKPAKAVSLSAAAPDPEAAERPCADPFVRPMHDPDDVSPVQKYDDSLPTGTPGVPMSAHPMRDGLMLLHQWVFLSADNSFFNLETGETMSRAAFDLAMVPHTPAVEYEKPDGSTDTKKFSPSKTLIEYLSGEVVSNYMYAPQLEGRIFEADGIRYVNTYLPRNVPAADPNWREHEAWQVVDGYMEFVYQSNKKYLLQWMAHNVQRPGVKILWSPILIGVEGDGKTTIGNILTAAMGRMNVRNVSQEALFSDFNSWAEGACVRVMDEIRVPGERRTAAMNKLKPVITNPTVEVVKKGKDGREVLNVTNYIAMSNHEDALALTENDRRWMVMRTRFKSKAQLHAETTREWWGAIKDAYEKHPEVIRGWLMSIDLSDFNPNFGPDANEEKIAMIEATRSPAEIDIREAIDLGGKGVSDVVLETGFLNEKIREIGGRQVSTIALANILREMGWKRLDARIKWDGKARRVYYRADKVPEGLEGLALVSYLRGLLDLTNDGGNDDSGSDEPLPW